MNEEQNKKANPVAVISGIALAAIGTVCVVSIYYIGFNHGVHAMAQGVGTGIQIYVDELAKHFPQTSN